MSDPNDNVEDLFRQAQAPPPASPATPQHQGPLAGVRRIAPSGTNNLRFAAPIVVFVVILAIGYLIFGGNRPDPAATSTAARTLLAIGANDYQTAYANLATPYKQKFSLETFTEMCAGDPKHWLIDSAEVLGMKWDGNVAVVNCKVMIGFERKQTPQQMLVKLIKEDGKYRVIGFVY